MPIKLFYSLRVDQQCNSFFVYFHCNRHRLQQLERESEALDQSFQAYLRRQQMSKQQMNDDASKIWENYTLSKAALARFDRIEDKHNITTALQPKLTDTMKVDYVLNSTFYDDVDIQEVLKDLNEIKLLKSPRFDKNEAFPSKNGIFTFKAEKNELKSQKNGRKENQLERQTKVENRMRETQKLLAKPSIILEEPIEPIPEKPIIARTVAVATEPKVQQQIKKPESIADSNFKAKPLKTNGLAVASNHESITKPKDSIEFEKLLNSEKTTQNEEINEKSSNVKEIPGALTNGHSVDKQAIDPKENGSISDLKSRTNEVITAVTATEPSKPEPIEKVPIIAKENGSEKMTSAPSMTNGFAKKLTTFMPIVSDSDSAEISEQISIGQQRLIKSPEDFWI